jgi:hypothetical protein
VLALDKDEWDPENRGALQAILNYLFEDWPRGVPIMVAANYDDIWTRRLNWLDSLCTTKGECALVSALRPLADTHFSSFFSEIMETVEYVDKDFSLAKNGWSPAPT